MESSNEVGTYYHPSSAGMDRKEYFKKKYQEQRKERLEYQNQYNNENKSKEKNKDRIVAYQRNYYLRRKNDIEYRERNKRNNIRQYKRKTEEQRNEKCIKRTKKLMTKMLRELLRRVALYEGPEPVDPEPEQILEPTPFAGIKLSSRGYFLLEW